MIEDSIGAFVPDGLFVMEGAAAGPLRGLSFAAKDIIDVAGRVTGCGNPDWARGQAAPAANAPVVQTMLDAGARLVGKTITDEMAYSLNGQNAHYGTPTNVNAPGRICGGSSCGSAAVVAAGVADFALGSDTGGSIRIPGSYCGLFGLRPTHGRIPLDGVMPLSPSLDTLGWFARAAGLLRRVGEVLLGGPRAAPAAPVLHIADDAFALLDAEVRERLDPWVARLEARYGPARHASLGGAEGLEAWMRCFRVVQSREAWAAHGAWIESARPRFGPGVAERFEWARTVGGEEAAAAGDQRAVLTRRLEALLAGGGVICLPTAPGIAPPTTAGGEALLRHRNQVLSLTSIAALAGLPQVTMPLAGWSSCPLGLSLMGARGSDLGLLALAESFCGDLIWPPAGESA